MPEKQIEKWLDACSERNNLGLYAFLIINGKWYQTKHIECNWKNNQLLYIKK